MDERRPTQAQSDQRSTSAYGSVFTCSLWSDVRRVRSSSVRMCLLVLGADAKTFFDGDKESFNAVRSVPSVDFVCKL